nr:CBS domain-containing protein [Geodermatophilus normandii]
MEETRPASTRVQRLVLDVPGWPGHLPGQHIDVRLTAEDGYTAQRSYSIASPPEDPRVHLLVEDLDGGEVSPYLTEEMQPGDSLEIRGPIGGYFVWSAAADAGTPQELRRPVQLVGGGAGVSPFLAMLDSSRRAGQPTPVRLLYSARTADDVLGGDLLGPETTVTLTRGAPADWRGRTGRVDGPCCARWRSRRPTGRGSSCAAPPCSSRASRAPWSASATHPRPSGSSASVAPPTGGDPRARTSPHHLPRRAVTATTASPTVQAVMRPPVTTVEQRAHLAAAAYLMKRSGDTALVVVRGDDTGIPLGIVTDADVTQAVADGRDLEQLRVSDVLSGMPVTVTPDTTVGEALRLMVQHRFHHLLVLADGRLTGIVDMMDLCRVSIDAGPVPA